MHGLIILKLNNLTMQDRKAVTIKLSSATLIPAEALADTTFETIFFLSTCDENSGFHSHLNPKKWLFAHYDGLYLVLRPLKE